MERPSTASDAAAFLREAGEAGRRVRILGGGTKLDWGGFAEPDAWVSTAGLDQIREHNAGDLTAVLEAGLPLAEAQAAFAEAGQMLALDPPLGAEDAATVGGVVATADAGPLRHRYGAARDLLLGVTVALSDGTVAQAGGKVIKNVAGYDLAKLFAGSFGTLGLIARVVVRLHPRPAATVTVIGSGADAGVLGRAALELAASPLELEALDVRWDGRAGAVLARIGGVALSARRARVAEAVVASGLETETHEDDEPLWAEQRARQRSAEDVVVRVSSLPTDLPQLLRVAGRLGGSVVGRAGLGLLWVTLPAEVAALAELRRELGPRPAAVLDAPPDLRAAPAPNDPALRALEARVRARFDPAGALVR
jgi:glycolate oxidase FAD binding subunit